MTTASNRYAERTSGTRAERRIARRLARRLAYYAMRPVDIDARLAELDREWPVDRALQANAATLTLAGTLLGVLVDRRYLWLPAAVGAFLLQHALRGWCPPLPVLRGVGMRTAEEIALERVALKALRGDFAELRTSGAWRSAPDAPGWVGPGTQGAPAIRTQGMAGLPATSGTLGTSEAPEAPEAPGAPGAPGAIGATGATGPTGPTGALADAVPHDRALAALAAARR